MPIFTKQQNIILKVAFSKKIYLPVPEKCYYPEQFLYVIHFHSIKECLSFVKEIEKYLYAPIVVCLEILCSVKAIEKENMASEANKAIHSLFDERQNVTISLTADSFLNETERYYIINLMEIFGC